MSLAMELPTKIGRLFMKRHYFQHMILSGALLLALGACVHKPAKTMKADTPIEIAAPLPQQVVLLQEARSEAENMRAELASLKILMAKQAGELRSLREQSQTVHHREEDQGLQLQNIRSQLISSQTERDQLRKHNMELEGQVSSMPDTSQLIADIQSLTGSFHQIMSSMKTLASDMLLIKQKMHITTTTLKPQQTKLTKKEPTEVMAHPLTPDAKGRIIIQEGDTLWKLSQTYQISVEQLREWNTISSDLIMTGLRLKVVEPMGIMETQSDPVKSSTPQTISLTKKESLDTQVQEAPQPIQESLGDVTSSSTHILSLSNSETDSHESP